MHGYNFWADLLQTWQSTSDWIKAVMILSAFAYPCMILYLVLCHRREMRQADVHSEYLAVRFRSMAFVDDMEEDWPEGLEELERVLMPPASTSPLSGASKDDIAESQRFDLSRSERPEP